MMLFRRKPLINRMVRRMYRKSGFLYLPCNSFFCKPLDSTVLLLLDTGSTASILVKNFVESNLDEKDIHYASGTKLLTAKGEVDCKSLLWVPFEDSNKRSYRDDFLVIDNYDSMYWLDKETGMKVVGILGTMFMEKYNMIVDFKTKQIIL